jgi:glycosyltransferase involved in cell wall biosynthesis
MPLRVLYNALTLTSPFSGVQVYSCQLIKQAIRENGSEDFRFIPLLPEKSSVFSFSDHILTAMTTTRSGRIVYEHTQISRLFQKQRATLLHAPSYILPVRFSGPSVLTVHDTIALDFPSYCKSSNVLYFNLLLKRSIRSADRIIAVSHQVKEDILHHCAIDPGRIQVVYHGVDASFRPVTNAEHLGKIRKKYRLPERYLLFVGNIEPKKNLRRVIEALFRIRNQIDHKLVIAGRWGWKYRPVQEAIRKYGMQDRVVFLDYVALADLPALYSGADLFLFPSLYEGFGLPVLEAMACGTPVMTSDKGSLPEISDGHAFYTNPMCSDEMARDILSALDNHSARLTKSRAGREYAAHFTWEKTWQRTKQIYLSMV